MLAKCSFGFRVYLDVLWLLKQDSLSRDHARFRCGSLGFRGPLWHVKRSQKMVNLHVLFEKRQFCLYGCVVVGVSMSSQLIRLILYKEITYRNCKRNLKYQIIAHNESMDIKCPRVLLF